jgi:hypothetical protein
VFNALNPTVSGRANNFLEIVLAKIAQSVEHFHGKEEVPGSIPGLGSMVYTGNMEDFPSPEQNEKQALIDVLKTKGLEDPESKELMIAWCEKKEAEVTAEGSREAQINFEIERAELYQESGNAEYAMSAFEDALMIAVNEGMEELVQKIEEKITLL